MCHAPRSFIPQPGPRRLDWVVPPEYEGIRVDTLLKKHMKLSGTVVRRVKWLDDGILVDGQRVNTRFIPKAGQTVSVRLTDPERLSGVIPAPGEVDIVYEDEDLIVVNKPAGLSVHPGPGHYSDTLGNFLVYYYETTGQEADFHPIHRLDRGTSGLLVAAKHPYAQELVKAQLHSPAFRRVYLAVCEGAPAPAAGVVDAPIGPVEGSLMAQQVRPDGKPARTHYETASLHGTRALLRLELETGRTHQIRVHMAYLGHPLTGDFLYGVEDHDLISRTALHSHRLTFLHPLTGEVLSFIQPLPEDMAALLARST